MFMKIFLVTMPDCLQSLIRIDELNILSEIEVVTHPVIIPADNTPAEDQWNHLKMMSDEYIYQDFLIKESFDKSNEVLAEVKQQVNMSSTPFQAAMNMSSFVYN